MSFRVLGLDPAKFIPLYGLSSAELLACGVMRRVADRDHAFPDRVEMRDVNPGETVLLLNYEHQPAASPYRSRHAIYVREGATEPYDRVDEIPRLLARRQLAVRSFDAAGMMIDGRLVNGTEAAEMFEAMLLPEETAYLHVHFAARGCYAARIERA